LNEPSTNSDGFNTSSNDRFFVAVDCEYPNIGNNNKRKVVGSDGAIFLMRCQNSFSCSQMPILKDTSRCHSRSRTTKNTSKMGPTSSPMVEALKKGTVKAFGTSYFTKFNEQQSKSNDPQKGSTSSSSTIPFPPLVIDTNINVKLDDEEAQQQQNRENNLKQFEDMASKLNESTSSQEAYECRSPEQKVKEKRRRRTTMFVKGSSTPDDVKSPSFKSYDLHHKTKIDFSDTAAASTCVGESYKETSSSNNIDVKFPVSTLTSSISDDSALANKRHTSREQKATQLVPAKKNNNSSEKSLSTSSVMSSQELYQEFVSKYASEKKLLQERTNEAENKLSMALAEHEALHFLNEVRTMFIF
jgi:hypothetical protein